MKDPTRLWIHQRLNQNVNRTLYSTLVLFKHTVRKHNLFGVIHNRRGFGKHVKEGDYLLMVT